MILMDIEKKYQKINPIEHILKRPGMYIGGIDEIIEQMWIYDENNKIIEKEIKFIPGLYKIFDEIIVNAYDQTIEDKTLNIIKVDITKDTISVFNNGKGIDVVIHPTEGIYVPELLFGELLTSTHFDEDTVRITGGLHGLGAKLTAIFSELFIVDIGDNINHKSFYQEYKNNLSKKSKPKVKSYLKKDGYVKITFKPDLKYFKLDEINDDFIKLMEKRVYDVAMLSGKKVKTYLNGNLIKQNDLESYMGMYTISQKVFEYCDNPIESKNRWKIGFAKSDNGFKCISFVNGINTWNNGKHVDYIIFKIIKEIKNRIEKKHKNVIIKDQYIKDNMMVIISATIENPSFSSQSKDQLITPAEKFGSKCNLTDKTIKKLYDILDVDTLVEKIGSSFLTKTTITNKIKGVPKLYDAYWAGTNKSNLCTLILTEGDSAKTMAISGLSSLNDPKHNVKGNDYYGVFPLKGKLLNVRDATKKKIAENEEFVNLRKIIGLEINKEYTNDNINKLRYGKIILMMDADVDGSHIKGLFINMLDYFWPSLLKLDDFLKIFITPIVKITKTNSIIEFFSLDDYNKWKRKVDDIKNYKIKYYKGLGTNTIDEAKAYFKNLNKYLIDIEWDTSASDNINLAFDKSMADKRKEWLKNYNPENVIDYTKKNITYTDFINKELIHFSNYDNDRSIPSMVDGLKPSQRKVLYCAFRKNLISDIKVAQFVGYISEHASYHHGEISLAKTIINMAQNFVGSNNINLLVPSGQFGSRLLGGRDAASPRYIYTRLDGITRLIFDQRDDVLLDYLNDEGYVIEPTYYVPILPMILVNGATGIGTGYNTYIPNYNPIDIIDILLSKLDKQEVEKSIHPYYKDYKGTIKKISNDLYETNAVYTLDSNTLKITELPIGVWTENYKIYLEEDNKFKDIIKKIKNNSDESNIDFIIKLKTIPEDLDKVFQLNVKINLGNMYLHDENGTLKKYNNVMEIINEFFDIRLKYYSKRKKYMLKRLEDEINSLEQKLRFIKFVISNSNVFKMSKEKLIELLINKKIIDKNTNYEELFRMPFHNLTKEKIIELEKNILGKQNEHKNIKKKSIENMWKDDLVILRDYLIKIENLIT
jgi:DNA topoisomerase-2